MITADTTHPGNPRPGGPPPPPVPLPPPSRPIPRPSKATWLDATFAGLDAVLSRPLVAGAIIVGLVVLGGSQ